MSYLPYILAAVVCSAAVLFVLVRGRKMDPVKIDCVPEESGMEPSATPYPSPESIHDDQKNILMRAVDHIYSRQAGISTDRAAPAQSSAEVRVAVRKILKAFEKIGTLHTSLSSLDRPDVSLKDVGDMVTRDPLLSAWVLKTVNSPVFRTASDVKSIHTAVNILGLITLKNLIAYGVMPHSLYRKPGHQQMFRHVWLHMNATALTASSLAKASTGVDSGFLYTAGLMHDIGKLALILLTDGVENGAYPDSLESEHELLMATHLDVLQIMVEDGSIPAQLGRLLLSHHIPASTKVVDLDCDGAMAKAMALLFVSNQIAKLVTARGTLSDDVSRLDQLDPSFAEVLSRDEARQLVLSPGLIHDILRGVSAARIMLE